MHSSALEGMFSIHLTAHAKLTYLLLTTSIHFMSKNLNLKDFYRLDGGKNHTITSLSSVMTKIWRDRFRVPPRICA
jgi:hypothetical protein